MSLAGFTLDPKRFAEVNVAALAAAAARGAAATAPSADVDGPAMRLKVLQDNSKKHTFRKKAGLTALRPYTLKP